MSANLSGSLKVWIDPLPYPWALGLTVPSGSAFVSWWVRLASQPDCTQPPEPKPLFTNPREHPLAWPCPSSSETMLSRSLQAGDDPGTSGRFKLSLGTCRAPSLVGL